MPRSPACLYWNKVKRHCHTEEKPHLLHGKTNAVATPANLKQTQILGSKERFWRIRICCFLYPQSSKAVCVISKKKKKKGNEPKAGSSGATTKEHFLTSPRVSFACPACLPPSSFPLTTPPSSPTPTHTLNKPLHPQQCSTPHTEKIADFCLLL